MQERKAIAEKKFFVANLKAPGLGLAGIVIALENWTNYFKLNREILNNNNLIIVAPPAIYLQEMIRTIASKNLPIAVASQDVSQFEAGDLTSEITAPMLLEIGVKYSIIGHSETRTLSHLTNKNVAKKIEQAEKYNLTPIVCVRGINEAHRSLVNPNFNGIIAYEPQAAIGTGQAADPNEADTICGKLKINYPNAHILYGGSVNKDNVTEFLTKQNIDGVLVGKKSIDPKFFGNIIETINEIKGRLKKIEKEKNK